MLALSTLPAMGWELEKPSRLTGKDRTVTVRAGRSLYDIARSEGYALEHLAEANDLPVNLSAVNRETVVVPSRRILPYEAPVPGVVVNLPERGFYVFGAQGEARFFPVALGQPGRFATPTGAYSIREKVKDPPWVAPEWAGLGENNVIPAGPDNPLGDRWIGLSAGGLGMHSTNNPMSIGSATSHGCMRMYPEVARTVFDLVEVGWPVRIEYQMSRVALAEDGIYLACFPDPYGRGGQKAQLLENFSQLDLSGFVPLVDLATPLKRDDGLTHKIVDLQPKVVVGTDEFPAAAVAGKLFLTDASLDKLGVKKVFRLADRQVVLSYQGQETKLPLFLPASAQIDDVPTGDYAFLSRGSAWLPAKPVLNALKLKYEYNHDDKRLRISS